MKFTVLASSSAGNCYLLESGASKILIEAGLNRKQTFARLLQMEVAPESINAIIVSHGHGDHAGALRQISSDLWNARIYASEVTAAELGLKGRNVTTFAANQSGLRIGDIAVNTFQLSHDSPGDAVGFSFCSHVAKVSTCTDLGFIDNTVAAQLQDSEILLLECSYDSDMLKVCPRPSVLKKRILSPVGHLSNEDCCAFLKHQLLPGPRTVILGHISRDANDLELVELMAQKALRGKDVDLRIFPPDRKIPLTIECQSH